MYVSDGSFYPLRAAAEERLARKLEHRRSSAERAAELCAKDDEQRAETAARETAAKGSGSSSHSSMLGKGRKRRLLPRLAIPVGVPWNLVTRMARARAAVKQTRQ